MSSTNKLPNKGMIDRLLGLKKEEVAKEPPKSVKMRLQQAQKMKQLRSRK
jgi:hypothetical protein